VVFHDSLALLRLLTEKRGDKLDPDLQRNLKFLVRLVIFVLCLISIYLLFIYVIPIMGDILSYLPVLFLPFLFAVILALLIEPVVIFFEQKLRLNRNASVITSLLVLVGGFIYVLSIILAKVISEVTKLALRFSNYSDEIMAKVLSRIANFKLSYLQLKIPRQVQDALESNLQDAVQGISIFMEKFINTLLNVITVLPGAIIFITISTVATFFIVKDRALIRDFILRFLPSNIQVKTREIITELFKALIGFIKAYSILITITAILTMISLKILGVEYILTLGLFVGLLDILPILGPGILFVPWIIWEFLVGQTGMGIGLIISYSVISIVRQFLEPKIIGDNIGLHPLATLVSLYVGLQLGGIGGMILGPVLLVIFIASYNTGLIDRIRRRDDI